jgi:hypothetical protein
MKGNISQSSVNRCFLRSQDQWSLLIVGTKSARVLKILERASIEATVLSKGCVEAVGELRGENMCGLKPL